MKACLICQHFSINVGYAGYSECTPGSPGHVDCAMDSKRDCPWKKMVDDREGDIPTPQFRAVAEQCPYFTLHESLTGAKS